MEDVALTDLSEPIRDFLVFARERSGVVIRDGEGRALLKLVPCSEPSREDRERALRELRRIQAKIGERLQSLGVTEEEFDRAVQEGD
jgi:hypothetical protein